MFFKTFSKMACDLQLLEESLNNNNGPNKKNDVITDLGGEGNFPMFLSGPPIPSHLILLQQRFLWRPAARWTSAL